MAEREHRSDLDELRAAWRALTPADPREAEPDAAERAALDWMRAAWATLEPPAAALPLRLRHRRLVRALPFAAALAAAAALFALLLLAPSQRAASDPAREALALHDPAEHVTEAPPARKPLAALARDDGGLELRHGSVRLILLPPDAEAEGQDR